MVLIFVDGLGIGVSDPAVNPCARPGVRLLSSFLDRPNAGPLPYGGAPFPVDALLGVPGLPQSATGQTALLTGVNAARAAGRHKEGFPNEALRQILLRHSILKELAEAGLRPTFLNAFRPRFFTFDEARKRRLSATTVAHLASGLPFHSLDDVKGRRSVYQDITNASLVERGFDVPLFTPAEAGAILARSSRLFDFTLFEYFQTDRAGHTRDFATALGILATLEGFLEAFLGSVDLGATTVLLCGDHGNIEDLTVKTHTTNPAMGIAWGDRRLELASRIRSLTDVTPALVELLSSEPPAGALP